MELKKENLTLIRDMARAQRVDMAEARLRGILNDTGFAQMVATCLNCAHAAPCRDTVDAGTTPQACPNETRWTALHRQLRG